MSKVKVVMFLVGVCSLLVSGMSDELQDLINSLHSECVADIGVSEDVVAQAKKGVFADDEKLKCYMKCLFEETGLVTEDGKIDVDGMIGMLPDEVKEPFSPTVRKCGATQSGSLCEISFQIYKCCYDEAPQYYFLP